MLVLDPTGSMCGDPRGGLRGAPTSRTRATGIKTFLATWNRRPGSGWRSCPGIEHGDRCATPTPRTTTRRARRTRRPALERLHVEPAASTRTRPSSRRSTASGRRPDLVRERARGGAGRARRDGRSNVQDMIVFLSDGAANNGPTYYPTTSPYRMPPCHQGISSAEASSPGAPSSTRSATPSTPLDGGANTCQDLYLPARAAGDLRVHDAGGDGPRPRTRSSTSQRPRRAEDDLHADRRRPAARHVGPDRRERAVTLTAFARRARRAGRAGRNVRPTA